MSCGWPIRKADMSKEAAKLYAVRDNLSLCKALILYNSRIYVPKPLRSIYLEKCHEGHRCITKCRRRAQRHFWWPGVSKEIAYYVEHCSTCIKHRDIKHQPMIESELPSAPWMVIGSDIFTFEKQLYLVVIDYYRKWIEVATIEFQTTQSVITALKIMFACFGIPQIIRSDNGTCFASKEFRDYARCTGFSLVTSSPRYPESNGLAESAVCTIKRLWQKGTDKDSALLAYRSTPLPSGYSPNELMFGRSVRFNLGLPFVDQIDYADYERKEIDRVKNRADKWNKKYRTKKLPDLQPHS